MSANIAQVRSHLERRRAELRSRTERVDRDLNRAAGPLSADFSEQAVQTQNDQTLSEIARAASEEIVAIDAAIERIDIGKYGLCRCCGEAIEARRLAAMPHAIACARCAD